MGLPPKPDDMKHFKDDGPAVKLLALFITKLPHMTYGGALALGVLIAKHYV